MTTAVHNLPDEAATAALAASFALLLRPGDVVALRGELGAGKTTFVRALAGAMGADPAAISSPTFVLVNQYALPAMRFTHVDAYRLRAADDLDTLGWDRLFTPAGAASGTVAVIEWPERLGERLPPHAAATLEATGPNSRRFTLDAPAWAGRPEWALFAQRPVVRCAVTNRWVGPLAPAYPFADARARDADLYGWFTGTYRTTRDPEPDEHHGP